MAFMHALWTSTLIVGWLVLMAVSTTTLLDQSVAEPFERRYGRSALALAGLIIGGAVLIYVAQGR